MSKRENGSSMSIFVIQQGLWPMNQLVKLQDGNWIMPGISAGPYSNNRDFAAAVAISHGDDFTKWDYVAIPTSQGIQSMWGESAIFVDWQGESTALPDTAVVPRLWWR